MIVRWTVPCLSPTRFRSCHSENVAYCLFALLSKFPYYQTEYGQVAIYYLASNLIIVLQGAEGNKVSS